MGQLNHSDSAVMIRMKTWVLVSRSLQLVLVLIVFLLTRFGLGTRVLQYGYENSNTLYPTSALVIGGGWDHFWLHSSLPVYLLIISSISLSEHYQPSAGRCKNLILTTVGGIIYIISGTATLNYYIPLESTSQYPRDKGLALGSLTIITGVIFLSIFKPYKYFKNTKLFQRTQSWNSALSAPMIWIRFISILPFIFTN